MIRKVTIEELLTAYPAIPCVDVRAPSEFEQGHIPGACSLPIFSNEERAQVGTTYKQQGHDAAVLLGFDITGPKWSGFIRQALDYAPDKKIAIHCWRGGMRSGAMAWALDFYGFEVLVVTGGYKTYRNWVLSQFEKTYALQLIGGMTGSGKTTLLHALADKEEQVIDLEELAQHKGSTYGTMNRLVQPTQEQFENNLAARLSGFDRERRIWMEDESSMIGRCLIPRPIWKQMREAALINITIPFEQRVQALVQEYGCLDKTFLAECTQRIWKRLGPEQTQQAVTAIQEDRMSDFVKEVLGYYDKTYTTGLNRRLPGTTLSADFTDTDSSKQALQVLALMSKHEQQRR
ncbi:tRNA 2-selenouridine(34) synthase MnmH [Sediminibacterium soli]|uniref:tRNA 2-selenouridine(34) synthase MnmH n=1 Tax=Sediminibacterium soli TaxID=2698829 RepID=UPI0013794722|nr:tRNA 2-selenouridine(34) synthase MnmH [Sediminibacterium soli]NCI47194.1 tRNA 2-selenouridine(34) synthase MnmH [Sediminibacterium soli]